MKANGYELYTKCADTEKYYNNAYMEYFTLNNYIGTDPSDKETIWQSTEGYYLTHTPILCMTLSELRYWETLN